MLFECMFHQNILVDGLWHETALFVHFPNSVPGTPVCEFVEQAESHIQYSAYGRNAAGLTVGGLSLMAHTYSLPSDGKRRRFSWFTITVRLHYLCSALGYRALFCAERNTEDSTPSDKEILINQAGNPSMPC